MPSPKLPGYDFWSDPDGEKALPELTAYHEAGHAFIAIYLGGQVRSITIDPDRDDGPRRFGDVEIAWSCNRFSPLEIHRNSVQVALAGPAAEMLYQGQALHPGMVSEWSDDWRQAWRCAAEWISDERKRLAFLEKSTAQLYRFLDQEHNWAAVAAIVDNLLAHERLEGAELEEIVAAWR